MPRSMKSAASRNLLFVLLPLCGGLLLALIALVFWLRHDPTADWTVSLPKPEELAPPKKELVVNIGSEFKAFAFPAPAEKLPGSWPRFRGPAFDNIIPDLSDPSDLSDHWPEAGPEVLWSVKLGEGHAAAAVDDSHVYLLDYDEESRSDMLRCFALDDGRELWQRGYELPAKRNHGLSRTIPAIQDGRVLTIGPRCHVMCVKANSGDLLWGLDLQKDYGTTEPLWFTGQCPLLDNGVAVIAPAGPDALMLGLDAQTGKVLWTTPNPRGWNMSHSSIMPMTLHGRKMYVYVAVGGLVAVAADGPDRGSILWDQPWSASVIAPSPVLLSDNRIYITAGYGAGSMMLDVIKTEEGFSSEVLRKCGPKEWLASEQQTPIYWNGLLYGIMPKDAGALKRQLVCYDPTEETPRWASGKAERFGLGPYLLAGDQLIILDDDGTLSIGQLSPKGFTLQSRHRVLDGHDAWGPLALAGTRLLLRDSTTMICLELGANP